MTQLITGGHHLAGRNWAHKASFGKSFFEKQRQSCPGWLENAGWAIPMGGQPGRTKSTGKYVVNINVYHRFCHRKPQWTHHLPQHLARFFSAQNDHDIFSRRRFPGGGGLTTSQGGWRVRRQGANFRSSHRFRISAPKKWCLCGCRTWINHEK